jgi:uncharacterized protein YqeY
MIKETIDLELKAAMKNRDIKKLGLLRVLKGELQRMEQTSKGKVELTDTDILKVIKKMVVNIKETTNDETEITILNSYLPKQLSDESIKDILLNVIKEHNYNNIKDMGKIMSHFNTNYSEQYDGKVLSNMIRETLILN